MNELSYPNLHAFSRTTSEQEQREGTCPVHKFGMIFLFPRDFSFITLVNDLSVLEDKAPLWCAERRETVRNHFLLIRLVKTPIYIVDEMGEMAFLTHSVGANWHKLFGN